MNYYDACLWVWVLVSVVVQVVRSAAYGSHFQHFTSWVWVLQTLYFVGEIGSTKSALVGRLNSAIFLPCVLSLVWLVFIVITFLSFWGISLITEAIDEYGEGTVWGVNFVLHYLTWCVLCVHVTKHITKIQNDTGLFIAQCRRNHKLGLYIFTAWMLLPTAMILTYLFWFSPSAEYGFSGISDVAGVLVSVFLVWASLAAYACVVYPRGKASAQ